MGRAAERTAMAVGMAWALAGGAGAATPAQLDWPSYNRTLTSERFTPLDEINRDTVAGLHALCTFDVGAPSNFQAGLIVIGGVLYGTAENATFAMDADTCALKWRVEEPAGTARMRVNRGLAYLDGRLFRGQHDGRVTAYDAATGARLWETRIADPEQEGLPSAPIAYDGMVFIGNSGSERFGVRGRMYALDAATGRQLWETYMVPGGPPDPAKNFPDIRKTWGNAADVPITGGGTWTSYSLDADKGIVWVPAGNPGPDFAVGSRPGANLFTNSMVGLDIRTGAYRGHVSIVPADFHDWDVAAAPALVTTRAGRRLMLAAPKDGRLYGYALPDMKRRFATAITTVLNEHTPLTRDGVRFCPGTLGGVEWNGPAYSPATNLVYVGAVDWCTTVRLAPPEETRAPAPGPAWNGLADPDRMGRNDPKDARAGWVNAVDADSGQVRWRFRTPAPVLAGVTPTAGGLVFAADMGGAAYAFDAADGKVLWRDQLGAPTGGGVISYATGGKQRVAVAAGVNSPLWDADKTNARIVIYGLR